MPELIALLVAGQRHDQPWIFAQKDIVLAPLGQTVAESRLFINLPMLLRRNCGLCSGFKRNNFIATRRASMYTIAAVITQRYRQLWIISRAKH